jgi:F-type H+-transporting ATPase subunit b
LIDINPGLLFVQIATFLFAILLLWRFLWKPLAKFMEKRTLSIQQDLAVAKKSREQAEEFEEQMKTRLAQIDEEARGILRHAADEGKQLHDRMLADAHEEARRLIENASRQIDTDKRHAIRELRTETVRLAVLIAEKAMKQSVDQEVQERLIKEFVEGLKSE